MKKSQYSSRENSDESYVAPMLERIYPVNVAFADAFNYETYCLHDKSLSYDGKKAARYAKLPQRMDTIMRRYMFNDSDPVTVLYVLEQFKRACDSNGVSEDIAI